MKFWRILDNQLHDAGDTNKLGFEEDDVNFKLLKERLTAQRGY